MLRFHAVHSSGPPPVVKFHEGDEVKLAHGTYRGTIGTFLHVNADPKWAEIREPDTLVRSHPLEWLEFARKR